MLSKGDLKEIQKELLVRDAAREKALNLSREATRLASWTIVQVHRRQLPRAATTLGEARARLDELESVAQKNAELRFYGNVVVARQEYAEAFCLLELARKGSIPPRRRVGVESIPYLLGLLDLIGEIRRMTLDNIRAGKTKEAERLLGLMEGIYEDLMALDRANTIPNFRRKMDVARKLVETTRGDVATDFRRISLEKSIKSLEKKLR